jgi:hypothetical protein
MTSEGLPTRRATRRRLRAAERSLGAFRASLVQRFGEPATLDRSEVEGVLPWSDGRSETWGIVEGLRLRFVSGVINRAEAEAIASEWRTLAGALGAAVCDDIRWRSLTIKSGGET